MPVIDNIKYHLEIYYGLNEELNTKLLHSLKILYIYITYIYKFIEKYIDNIAMLAKHRSSFKNFLYTGPQILELLSAVFIVSYRYRHRYRLACSLLCH